MYVGVGSGMEKEKAAKWYKLAADQGQYGISITVVQWVVMYQTLCYVDQLFLCMLQLTSNHNNYERCEHIVVADRLNNPITFHAWRVYSYSAEYYRR